MNKNISIWRGSETPPTLSHIWVKDGSFYIYINEEWKPVVDPELLTKIEEYNENIENTLNEFQQSINQDLEDQSLRLENYVDEEITKIQDIIKESDALNLQHVDLNDEDQLLNIKNSLEDNTLQFYKVVDDVTSNFEILENKNIKKDTICYFEHLNKANIEEDLNTIDTDCSIYFNKEFYHIIFGDPSTQTTFAIEDIEGQCRTRNAIMKDSQLWEFIGTPSYFKIRSKEGRYIYKDSSGDFYTSETEFVYFKLIKTYYYFDSNSFAIALADDETRGLNCNTGVNYDRKITTWRVDNDCNSQICIVKFFEPDVFSTPLTQKNYILYFSDYRNQNYAMGFEYNPTTDSGQVCGFYLNSGAIPKENAEWQFMGNSNSFYITHSKYSQYYMYYGSSRLRYSNVQDNQFCFVFYYQNNKQYISLSHHSDEGRVIVVNQESYIDKQGLLLGGSQSPNSLLTLSLTRLDLLKCNSLQYSNIINKINGKLLNQSIKPNTYYSWGMVDELNISLENPIPGVINEYIFSFDSGINGTILNIQEDIKWANGSIPSTQPNRSYLVKIIDKLGTFTEFI